MTIPVVSDGEEDCIGQECLVDMEFYDEKNDVREDVIKWLDESSIPYRIEQDYGMDWLVLERLNDVVLVKMRFL